MRSIWLMVCLVLLPTTPVMAVDFAKEIRPIFEKHCFSCHGPEKQKSGFRLDLRAAALKDEIAIVPGKADESPLIDYVSASVSDGYRMPPEGKGLSKSEIEALRKWINAGAPWPDAFAGEDTRLKHWAWQPLSEKQPPSSRDAAENPIDGFIRAKLKEKGLTLSPEANRRTLIRRLSFDLHGLPPAPEAVEAFVNDSDPEAYEKLVSRMLDSPHYGERYAQHWLDIAHYADTHGFERDMRRPHAWHYRDYVIQAFNEDKPYDRFLQEQIAGDVLWPGQEEAVIATGFLAAGPWDYVGQVEAKSPVLNRAARSLDLDDMATQVITTTVGMTVNCARCHDHKLDPISQKEYYQFRAVFAGIDRGDRVIKEKEYRDAVEARARLEKEINQLVPSIDLADVVGGGDGTGLNRLRRGIDLRTGAVDQNKAAGDFKTNDLVKAEHDFIEGVFVPKHGEPISTLPVSLSNIPRGNGTIWDIIRNGPVNGQFSSELGGVDFNQGNNTLLGLHANAGITFNLNHIREAIKTADLRLTAQVGYFGRKKEGYFADVSVFVDGNKVAEFLKLRRADGLKRLDIPIPENAQFLTLISTDGGNGIAMDQIGFGNPKLRPENSELPSADREQLARLVNEKKRLDELIASLDASQVYAAVSKDKVPNVFVLRRGDSESPFGDPLEPGAFSALAMLNPDLGSLESTESERRVSLARWITDPQNPLTSRVIANRLWQWHFSQGIVDTPSDFGLGGGTPSHLELLDWLAAELQRQNWSLKALHRLILTSETYKQDSRFTKQAPGIDVDAGNRLLWRQNSRRIEAEAVRDAVLFVSGKLNFQAGGPGFEDFEYESAYAPIYRYVTADKPALWRRSIYRYRVRTTPNRFLTTLDCPDPANMTPKRLTTTTPLQSLALYNNDFMLRQARYLAERIEQEAGSQPVDQVKRAFELALGRTPTEQEISLSTQCIGQHSLFAFCRSLFNTNEFVYVD